MMPPLPITLGFAVLLGYPLVQIVAIRLRRTMRLSYRERLKELQSSFPDEVHQRVFNEMLKDSHGSITRSIAQLMFPMFMLALLFSGERPEDPEAHRKMRAKLVSFSSAKFKISPDDAIWKDERFFDLVVETAQVSRKSSPITCAVNYVLMTPVVLVTILLRRRNKANDLSWRQEMFAQFAALDNYSFH